MSISCSISLHPKEVREGHRVIVSSTEHDYTNTSYTAKLCPTSPAVAIVGRVHLSFWQEFCYEYQCSSVLSHCIQQGSRVHINCAVQQHNVYPNNHFIICCSWILYSLHYYTTYIYTFHHDSHKSRPLCLPNPVLFLLFICVLWRERTVEMRSTWWITNNKNHCIYNLWKQFSCNGTARMSACSKGGNIK